MINHEQRKEYFLAEIEEITGTQANIAAIVTLLMNMEPGLKRILNEFLGAYQEGFLDSKDCEEILAYTASRIQRKYYPNVADDDFLATLRKETH